MNEIRKDERVEEWGKRRIREAELPELPERLMLYMIERADSCPGSRAYCKVSGTVEDAAKDLGVDRGEIEAAIEALYENRWVWNGMDVSPALPDLRFVFPTYTNFYTDCVREYREYFPEYGELLQYVRDTYSPEELTNYFRELLENAASRPDAEFVDRMIKRELDNYR